MKKPCVRMTDEEYKFWKSQMREKESAVVESIIKELQKFFQTKGHFIFIEKEGATTSVEIANPDGIYMNEHRMMVYSVRITYGFWVSGEIWIVESGKDGVIRQYPITPSISTKWVRGEISQRIDAIVKKQREKVME